MMNDSRKTTTALIAYGMATIVVALFVTITACIPKHEATITDEDLEILLQLKIDAMDLISYYKLLITENRPPTIEEAENIEQLSARDIMIFEALMGKIAATKGTDNLAFKILKKILEAKGVL